MHSSNKHINNRLLLIALFMFGRRLPNDCSPLVIGGWGVSIVENIASQTLISSLYAPLVVFEGTHSFVEAVLP